MSETRSVAAGPTPLGSVGCRVDATAAAWRATVGDPAGLDWPALLLGALQHRVEGLCLDALRSLGWHHQAPPTVLDMLDRRTLLAEARFLAHYRALCDLQDLDAALVSTLVVVSGMALAGDYESTGHRLVGDVDLVVEVEHADRLAARTRTLGYWEKLGPTGPTYFRDDVALDVHYVPPTLWGRSAVRSWWDGVAPHAVGDLSLRRATRPLELVDLLVRLQRRAASWARWTRDDAVRLVDLLDVELVATGGCLAVARSLGVVPELALGLAVVKQVRGALPSPLADLDPYAGAVAPCADLLTLPDGELVAAGEPLVDRVLALEASSRAKSLCDHHRPDEVFTWRHGYADERATPPCPVVARAAKLLAAAGLPA